jgi:hypothetical protein
MGRLSGKALASAAAVMVLSGAVRDREGRIGIAIIYQYSIL